MRETRLKTWRLGEHQRKDFGGRRGPCDLRKWRGLALLKLEEGIEKKMKWLRVTVTMSGKKNMLETELGLTHPFGSGRPEDMAPCRDS